MSLALKLSLVTTDADRINVPMVFEANISNPSEEHNVCTMSNQSFLIVRTLHHICFTTLDPGS